MKQLSFIALTLVSIVIISACNSQKSENGDQRSQEEKTATPQQQISEQQYFQAALNGDFNTLKKAIDNGMDVNATGQTGNTALMLAAYNGHKQIVDFLLQKGANVNKQDANQRTALLYAASGDNPETVQALIDAGAEIDHTDKKEGFSPLMFAAAEGQTEVVKTLLEAGADKTVKDKDGDTALDFARENGHSKTAELLAE